MRAWQMNGPTLEKLLLVERAEPAPKLGEVVIQVKATSLNYRDLLIATGAYRIGAKYPIVPLSDGAGEVVAVGSDVKRFKVGDRVVSSFFYGWVDGEQTAARSATALGGGAVDGMLADRVALPEEGVLATPSFMTDAEAATLPCAAVTAWHALYEGEDPLRPGQTVLLEGTGGVSIAALQIAKMGGARVVITSSSDGKLARARELGADETINYRTNPEWQDAVRKWTGGRGVDHVVEVGGKDTLGRALQALRYRGQLHLIGGVSGFATDLPLGAMAANNARVRRIYVGSVAMFESMNRAFEAHRVRPVVDRTFPFAEARAAFEHMKGASHFGKIVIAI
jgi:NADPH:quinone reductase-like Zn-dependent oxidoreductase